MYSKIPLLAILGPTASGKSSLSLKLAKRINSEIISCDSMQIYKGLNIGTATPSKKQLKEIPHYFINSLEINQKFDANIFATRAKKIIADIKKRKKVPILTGGTGLYAKILLYGVKLPPSNKKIASDLLELSKSKISYKKICDELKKKDLQSFKDAKKNKRRILRALEIIRITGKPISNNFNKSIPDPDLNIKEWILIHPPEKLRQRIRERTYEMLKNGWIEETKKLIATDFFSSPTARQALGYKYIADYLKGDIKTFEELAEKIIVMTGRYAKKQRTWFRNQHPKANIVNPEEYSEDELINLILKDASLPKLMHKLI
ncbi:MAG: tRNA (adenosine(37)-N6)-dimethylallyltransferase MiaA [Verrucomicrobiota bacterium]|nr:tRNA (adenosine(37)-N6)-dimethylallyltransferase MiaA [Verrucomicrobiota bacterium]